MQKEKLDTEIEMAVVINSVLFFSGYEKKNIISDGLWPLLSYCQHFFLITANAIKYQCILRTVIVFVHVSHASYALFLCPTELH